MVSLTIRTLVNRRKLRENELALIRKEAVEREIRERGLRRGGGKGDLGREIGKGGWEVESRDEEMGGRPLSQENSIESEDYSSRRFTL